MKGFKQYLYNEMRHLFMDEPIQLRIEERGQTKTVTVEGFDMKFEFYTDANKMIHRKWVQELPQQVRTRPGQVLVNEGYYAKPGGRFYLANVNPEMLRGGKVFVDTKTQQLVSEMGDPSVVIECDLNPLDEFRIPLEAVVDKQHRHISVVRPGYEKKMFDWWDFVECTGPNGYAKRSCHLDVHEIGELLRSKGIE